MLILDGSRLAAERAAHIAQRAERVRNRRARAPRLLLVAFADSRGGVPHVQGKLRACENAGVDAVALRLDATVTTGDAVRSLIDAIAQTQPDGVFVQVPFPGTVDGDAVIAAIPDVADVDIMTPGRVRRYMSGADDLPPVTIAAALLLLDAYRIDMRGRTGVIIAETGSFTQMFGEALRRRGVRLAPLIDPRDIDTVGSWRSADIVVVAAGQPGLVSAGLLQDGAIAIDVGYFNEGGSGDIDASTGIERLAALMPVPGGIGPMTVSALIERVVMFAEEAMEAEAVRNS